ncbi:MAG TPA: hypothetical protein PLP83_06730, partial [Candidatus Aminicenantes bacterium]|nr:hypothetical protein [Candidatus Aminicenantes bacterium]
MDRPRLFESSFADAERLGRTRRDRLTGALVTLAVHGLLGLLVYHGRFVVKVLPIDRKAEVRDVVLVPPLKVSVPKVIGGRGLAAEPAEALGRPGPAGAAQPRTAPEKAEPPPGEAAGPPGAPAGGPGGPPGPASAIPSLSSKFRESLTVRGRNFEDRDGMAEA